MMHRRTWLLATALAVALAPAHLLAAYPAKPIRLIVPVAAGGASDGAARIVARHLQDRLKQTVIVDNRAGGASNIGADAVAKAPADGYTLLLSGGPFAINPSLFRKLPFDAVKDFQPVALIASFPSVLLVRPSLPAKNIREFVALSKDGKTSISVATPGNGSAQHLALELLRRKGGNMNLLHVPYKGGAPAMQDLLGGQVDAMMANIIEALPHIKSGKLRAIAVTTQARSTHLAEVPTLMEVGLADSGSGGWVGLHVPAGAPADAVKRLHDEVNAILEMPDVREQLATAGFDVRPMSHSEFADFVQRQMATWKEAVALSGAQVD